MLEWIDNVKSFITSFTKFLDDNDNAQLIRYLEGGSGFLSLGVGITNMIIDNRKCQESEKERSISDLFAFLIPFTFNQIKTIIQSKNINEKKFNKNELKQELKKFFSVYNESLDNQDEIKSPWLPLHPLIQKFKYETIKYIAKSKDLPKITSELKSTFEDRIEYDLYRKPELELFRKLVAQELRDKELMKYLDLLIKDYQKTIEKERKKDLSPVSNFSIYVKDRKAIELTIKDHWNENDSNIYKNYDNNIKYIEELLDEFIDNNDSHKLIIGSPYGVGKTILVKQLAYDYAKKRAEDAKYRIPIVVYLKNRLRIEKREGEYDSLQNYLLDLFGNECGKKISKPVLFIFDALDEYYHENIDMDEVIESEILKIVNLFSDNKVIFTTRLLPDYLDLNRITTKYLRLLPFDKKQVNHFLQQKKSNLTYDELNKILDHEIIVKPLTLAIIEETYPKLKKDFERLEKDQKLTTNLSKTLLYIQMFYDLYHGKSKKTIKEQYKNNIQISFQKEKKILRLISFYKQIKDDITVKELREWSKQPNLAIANIDPVIKTYFSFTTPDNQRDEDSNRRVFFIHQTYKEFLLAEYIIEQYINKNISGLNVGKPSEVTIDFLKGFLDMMILDKEIIRKFIIGNENYENSLIYSIEYKHHSQPDLINEIKHKIKEIAKESFHSDLITILQITDENKFNNQSDLDKLKWYQSFSSEVNSYENLWIPRWISLIILGYLDKEIIKNKLEKNKLKDLILHNSHNVPSYVKYLCCVDLSDLILPNADLSHAYLSHAQFSRANLPDVILPGATLSHANLSDAYLSRANLYRADLSHAILPGANLSSANLSRANLGDAILPGAILSDAYLSHAILPLADLSFANLINANLSSANLSGVNLSHANLSDANLIDANLSSANLSGVNLSHANLFDANLFDANLSHANLSHANLSHANLSNSILANAIILNISQHNDIRLNDKTNFDNSILDDRDFIKKLQNYSCKNIPNPVQTKKKLREKLKEKKLDEQIINIIVNQSKI